MSTPQASFGVSRRILLSSLALLPALIGPLRPISVLAQAEAFLDPKRIRGCFPRTSNPSCSPDGRMPCAKRDYRSDQRHFSAVHQSGDRTFRT
jgi:hypothetical protein